MQRIEIIPTPYDPETDGSIQHYISTHGQQAPKIFKGREHLDLLWQAGLIDERLTNIIPLYGNNRYYILDRTKVECNNLEIDIGTLFSTEGMLWTVESLRVKPISVKA